MYNRINACESNTIYLKTDARAQTTYQCASRTAPAWRWRAAPAPSVNPGCLQAWQNDSLRQKIII